MENPIINKDFYGLSNLRWNSEVFFPLSCGGGIIFLSAKFLTRYHCWVQWFFLYGLGELFYGILGEVSQCVGCGWLLAYDMWCWIQEDAVLGEEGFLCLNLFPTNTPHTNPTVLGKKSSWCFLFVTCVSYFGVIYVLHTIELSITILSWSSIICIYSVLWYRWELKLKIYKNCVAVTECRSGVTPY